MLVEFRQRLLSGNRDLLLFDLLLTRLREGGYLKARGRQRSDSTHVLAKIRTLNRVEGVGETFRAALNSLAVAAPEWLMGQIQADWVDCYEHRVEDYRLPTGKQAPWPATCGQSSNSRLRMTSSATSAMGRSSANAWARKRINASARLTPS